MAISSKTVKKDDSYRVLLRAGQSLEVESNGYFILQKYNDPSVILEQENRSTYIKKGPFPRDIGFAVKVISGSVVVSVNDLDAREHNEIVTSQNGSIKTEWDRLPGFVIFGDSLAARGNKEDAVTSITASGTTATLTTSVVHQAAVGSRVMVQGADQHQYNGYYKILSLPTTSSLTYEMSSAPSITTATGNIKLNHQEKLRDTNWAAMSNALSGGKGLYLGNYGLGGSPTSELAGQMAIGINPDNNVWGVKPDIAFICSGINDGTLDVLSDATIENLRSAINTLLDADIFPIVTTIFPRGSGSANWSVARVVEAAKVNTWLRQNEKKEGFMLIDGNAICMDTATQYGEWKTNYSQDGVHLNKKSSNIIAAEIKAKLWDKIETKDHRNTTVISLNPTMSGTSGDGVGSGTGDIADDYNLRAFGGGSQLADGEKGLSLSGGGESQRVDLTGAADQDRAFFNQDSIHASVSPGDKVFFSARFRTNTDISTAFIRYVSVESQSTAGGVASESASFNDDDKLNQGFVVDGPLDMIMETPPMIIPPSLTALTFNIAVATMAAGGTATFDVSDYKIMKVDD